MTRSYGLLSTLRRGRKIRITSHPKRPRDPNQFAKSIIDIATGEAGPLHAIDERVLKEDREPRRRDCLHTMYYNFVRIHQTLKVPPAMAAGVTEKLWEVSDIVAMLE
jgi:hypothetical protein